MKRLWAVMLLLLCGTVELLAQNPNTAIFTGAPGVAATDSDLLVATNSAQSTLNGAVNSSQTTVTVANASVFTTPAAIKIESEILKCTSKSGNTLTCSRGFDGSTPTSHSDGTAVFGYLFDWHHNQIAAEIKALEANVPTKAPLNSPTFTGTVDSSGAAHTLPAKKGTIAALPSSCVIGEEYFATDAAAGQNKYYCTAINTWTQQLNSGGGGGAVSSVFGRTGAVVAVSGDYSVGQVTGAAPTASPTFTGTLNAGGASHTIPSVKGTAASIPATCTQGEEYFATDATAGRNKYFCTATNVWTQQAVGAVTSVFSRTGAVTATTGDYSVGQITGAAPLASPTFTGTVDASGATHTLPVVKGTIASKPAACTQGEEYFATDATAGQNMFYCTAVNTWTQQLNSGGGGTVSSVFGRTGSIVATTGDYGVAQVTGAAPTASPTFTGTVVLPSAVTLNGAALNAANGLLQLNSSGRVTPTQLVFTMPVFAEFSSICQAGTAVIGFSLTPSNSPTANCVTGANTNLGVATFTATGQTVQGRLLLPNDWTSTVDLDVRFRGVGTTGNTVWNVQTACVANTGATIDPAFNAANTGSVAARGTTLQDNQVTLTSITMTGCAAGNMLLFQFGLDASTTTTGNQDLYSIRFTIRRLITAS